MASSTRARPGEGKAGQTAGQGRQCTNEQQASTHTHIFSDTFCVHAHPHPPHTHNHTHNHNHNPQWPTDDELLVRWRKLESPFLHLPPSHLQLTGWRDPFIFVTNTAARPGGWAARARGMGVPTRANAFPLPAFSSRWNTLAWMDPSHPPRVCSLPAPPPLPADGGSGFSANGYSRSLRMLIGSGLKGQGGTALVYKSRSLLEGGLAWVAVGGSNRCCSAGRWTLLLLIVNSHPRVWVGKGQGGAALF